MGMGETVGAPEVAGTRERIGRLFSVKHRAKPCEYGILFNSHSKLSR